MIILSGKPKHDHKDYKEENVTFEVPELLKLILSNCVIDNVQNIDVNLNLYIYYPNKYYIISDLTTNLYYLFNFSDVTIKFDIFFNVFL